MVSHAPPLIANFCDRAILIESGRIHTEGPPATVVEAYSSVLTAVPLNPAPVSQPRV
jgi:ABC-type polysaccharide/polyol phosphate transport system ATPase subunit